MRHAEIRHYADTFLGDEPAEDLAFVDPEPSITRADMRALEEFLRDYQQEDDLTEMDGLLAIADLDSDY